MTTELDKKMTYLEQFITPSINILGDTFMLLKDHDGWTNAFIADLTDTNVATMQAKAQLKKNMVRVVTDKEKCPLIQPQIDRAHLNYARLVTDVEVDLTNGFIKLIAASDIRDVEDYVVWVNGKLLMYFVAVYDKIYDKLHVSHDKTTFKITEPLDPIGVFKDEKLVGLVMPVRAE